MLRVKPVSYTHLQIQLMTEEEADNYRINPFDLTKVWPHKDFPLQDVGILELNRNPENYFADVEQAAFNPINTVDGIGFSPDKMLQGRDVYKRQDPLLSKFPYWTITSTTGMWESG